MYECYYGPFKADAQWTDGGVYCALPDQRPQLVGDVESIVVPLAIRSSTSRYNIIAHNFTFFDCSRHTM